MQCREVERRRDQHEATDRHADVVGQFLRHGRRPEPAIALADEIDRRAPALMPGQPESDDRAERGDIGAHVPERLVRVFLLALAAAEAGADRVDEDEVGEAEPCRRVVDEVNRRARHRPVFRRLHDPRPERTQMQKDRGRAGTPVEHEADRPAPALSLSVR